MDETPANAVCEEGERPPFDAKAFLKTVPESAGVYRMVGADGQVLYVGKAKNLKKRVSCYFRRQQPSARIAHMVSQIDHVELTLTRSEAEALLLENNLIKTLSPRYNILFRDDKSYPYIAFSAHEFPRLSYHRGAFVKGARYFGPFPNGWAVRESIDLLQKTFRLRTCENGVFQNRARPCLLHQIKRCTAPCMGLVSAQEYARDVELAVGFLDGRGREVIAGLHERMQAAAEVLDFESAALCRDRIRALQTVLHRQFVDSGKNEDVDILAACEEEGEICINLAMVRGGRHLGDRPLFPGVQGECSAADALAAFIEQHYREHPLPGRVLVQSPDEHLRDILAETHTGKWQGLLAAPRHQAEKAWMAMALENARNAIAQRLREGARIAGRVRALAQLLGMTEAPRRIECFDISHTQGEAPVASCVVCVDGVMASGEYRRYNIAGVTPGDDYAAMRQALERRYAKVAEGQGVRPDLILIDGGRGQVHIARDILGELGLSDIAMVGVVKGEGRKVGLERIVFPDDRPPVTPGATHPALHLFTEIRDEAHRFAITGHRARRNRARTHSRLEDIPGVGPTRRRNLLAAFGGLEGVRQAAEEDLRRVPGISRQLAAEIHAFFR